METGSYETAHTTKLFKHLAHIPRLLIFGVAPIWHRLRAWRRPSSRHLAELK